MKYKLICRDEYFIFSVFKVSHFDIPASESGLVIDDKGDKAGKGDDYHDPNESEHTHGIGEATEFRC